MNKASKALLLAEQIRRRQDGGGTDDVAADDQPQLQSIPKQDLPDYYPQSPQSPAAPIGRALQAAGRSAADWYQSQPSWLEQAQNLENQRIADPAGDLDRRIAFAQGMVGPQAGIMAGRLATGADLPALRAATKMEGQGAPRADIWNQTGWYRGPDKAWRFEISDQPAKLTGVPPAGAAWLPQPMDAVMEHPELYRNYPSIRRTLGDLNYGERLGGSFGPATSKYPALIEANAPEQITPELRERLGKGFGGMEPFDLRGATLHELQHNVQNIERFAPGSNPAWLNFSRDPRMMGLLNQNAQNNFGKPFFDLTTEQQQALQRAIRNEWYMRSAGEVEARNVTQRANMTAAERRATPPWETLDRPETQLRVSKPGPRSRTARQEGGGVDAATDDQRDDQPQLERIPVQSLPDYYQQSPQSPAAPAIGAAQRAIEAAANWYKSQPSWLEQASELERQRQIDPQGDLDRRIAFASGMVGPEAGTISRPTGTLFDLSRLSQVPDVPQTAMPRYVPPHGTPQQFIDLANDPKRLAAINKTVGAGTKLGGLEWYNTLPLRDVYQEQLGAKPGMQEYTNFMNAMGATSPRSVVPKNIPLASYYQYLVRNQKPLPQVIQTERGDWGVPTGEIPEGYGSIAQAQHVRNMMRLVGQGQFDPMKNPKPLSFSQNLQGNYYPLTSDVHNMRLMRLKGEEPGIGYGYLEDLERQQANKMSLPMAQYQASGWLGGAEQTGVKSGYEPFMGHFENAIRRTAEDKGLTPQEALRQFIAGKIYLSHRVKQAGGAVGLAHRVAQGGQHGHH